MQAEERQPVSVGTPQRYSYFRLLQVLRAAGVEPLARNDTTLAFPVSDIAGVDGGTVRPAFMGLLGAAGALPYHYTERIASAGDSAPREFLDMLSARALEQFDLAWRKQRPSRDALLRMLMSLGGVSDPALAQYAALTRRAIVPAGRMGRVLGEYFGVPVRVEQFVGGWLGFAPRDRNALGAANNVLARDAALGGRQWRCDLRLRVHVGPLAGAAYREFLPCGAGADALARMVAGIIRGGTSGTSGTSGAAGRAEGARAARVGGVGGCDGAGNSVAGVGVEVWVGLEAEEVRGVVLGGESRLGYNAFVLTGHARKPRSDLRYQL